MPSVRDRYLTVYVATNIRKCNALLLHAHLNRGSGHLSCSTCVIWYLDNLNFTNPYDLTLEITPRMPVTEG